MHLEWLASPITLCALLAMVLVCALVLFVSLKCEIAAARQLARKSGESADQLRTTITSELASLRDAIPVVEIAPPPAGDSLNLTRRAAALRMGRRGEAVPTIAAALRVPQNEIELMMKLQKLTNQAEIHSA